MSENTQKKETTMVSDLIKLGLILMTITLVVALLLGLTNAVTKDRIAQVKAVATAEAMEKVMEADSYEAIEGTYEEPVEEVSRAIVGGETAGYCVKVSPSGYSDIIELMVGIDSEGAVTGVSIISISDTPGLGAKADDPAFLSQYEGKSGPLAVVKNQAKEENDIVALSGATRTSRGVTEGVQAALDTVAAITGGGTAA